MKYIGKPNEIPSVHKFSMVVDENDKVVCESCGHVSLDSELLELRNSIQTNGDKKLKLLFNKLLKKYRMK